MMMMMKHTEGFCFSANILGFFLEIRVEWGFLIINILQSQAVYDIIRPPPIFQKTSARRKILHKQTFRMLWEPEREG